ncbi:MAG: dipeptidase PepE [Flavobacteriales bacterium]|nr:dipeptidase PepE [Flavobacteriales bacterium]
MPVNTQLSLLIASTSKVHGMGYLEYARDIIMDHFSHSANVLFIPFARPDGMSHDDYTEVARSFFKSLGKGLRGAHEFDTAHAALDWCDGIFTGGGNTFVLVTELYNRGYMDALPTRVRSGLPYMGTSAGSNVTGLSMMTTNDMPIMYPPSFITFGLVPFNINPHYLDPDPGSTHMGETRETRIREFHAFNATPVVGLREGSCIWVRNGQATLTGQHRMRLFEQGKEAREVEAGADLNFLFDNTL